MDINNKHLGIREKAGSENKTKKRKNQQNGNNKDHTGKNSQD